MIGDFFPGAAGDSTPLPDPKPVFHPEQVVVMSNVMSPTPGPMDSPRVEPPKVYRMLRVLEYVGDREFIESHMRNRGVKGHCPDGWRHRGGQITEAFIGEIPTLLRPGDIINSPFEKTNS